VDRLRIGYLPEGENVIHPLAAGVYDVEFMCREMVTEQCMRESNIYPPCAQRISGDRRNDMLTSPTWVLVAVLRIGYRGVNTIEYRQTDGIVRIPHVM
jgi:hypothetical protein